MLTLVFLKESIAIFCPSKAYIFAFSEMHTCNAYLENTTKIIIWELLSNVAMNNVYEAAL